MMQANYESWLADPSIYKRKVEAECGLFPEGHLYPYFLPAMAFAHLASQQPEHAAAYLAKAEQLIKMGLPEAGRIVNDTNGDLLNLQHYDKQATTLSTVSLALGLYQRAGGQNAEFTRYHRHVNQLLADALIRADGAPIASYPNYSWNYDTVASLLALRMAPEMTPGISVDALWKKHENWVQRYAFDHANKLPYSIAGFGYPEGPQAPRGCDVLMRVMVLAYVDPGASQDLFARTRQSLERQVGQFYGFAEFPKGAPQFEDNDSGPIIMDMGLTATGLAIGAALAANQPEIANRLSSQFVFREPLMLMTANMDMRQLPGDWFWHSVRIKAEYFTGFLFGDAVLFYTLTWSPTPHQH